MSGEGDETGGRLEPRGDARGDHLGDLELDALRLGGAARAAPLEAAATSGDEARAHLAACASCRDRSAQLAAQAEAFGAAHDVAALAAAALARPRLVPEPIGLPLPGLPPSGASPPAAGAPPPRAPVVPLRASSGVRAAVVALTALAASTFILIAPHRSDTRIKGAAAAVELFVVDGAGEPRAVSGPIDARAQLAVRVDPGVRHHVRLLWSAAPDEAEALHPAATEAAWMIDAPTWLERRIELDGAPEPERLLAVTCAEPFDDAEARVQLAAAGVIASRRGAAPRLSGCEVHAVEVTKR